MFLLWRSFRGFCWTDESFYVSTADRFWRGDIPLVNEWFRTQMSSVIMLPFYSLYMLIAGSNTGIILYFRILYLLFSTAVALVWHHVLRRQYPDHVALAAGLIIMCYAHLNNATLSYYMLSTLAMSLALILIYDHMNKAGRYKLVFAGFMIALSVLSMPLFAVGYVLVMLFVLIAIIIGRIPQTPPKLKEVIASLKLWEITVCTLIGIAVPAVIFIILMISRTDIGSIIRTLPYALVDREHSNTWGYYIRKPHRCLMDVFGIYTYVAYAIIAVSFAFQKILKKHPLCELVVLADCLLFAVMAYLSAGHTGYILVAFFMFMIPVFFVSERKNHVLFWLCSIPAVIVAITYSFASSDFLYVIALGLSIASGAGVCVLYDHVSGNVQTSEGTMRKLMTAVSVLLVIVCVFTVGDTFVLRMKNVYRDAPVSELDQRITTGIAKGLYTTEEHLQQYNDVYTVVNDYCRGDGYVLFSKILPWGYLVSEKRCGYPTTWRATAYDDEQLEMYYKINPFACPDVIIVLDEQYGSYDASGDVEDDHNPNLDEMGDYWKDYIRASDMDERKVKCGKVYRKGE